MDEKYSDQIVSSLQYIFGPKTQNMKQHCIILSFNYFEYSITVLDVKKSMQMINPENYIILVQCTL